MDCTLGLCVLGPVTRAELSVQNEPGADGSSDAERARRGRASWGACRWVRAEGRDEAVCAPGAGPPADPAVTES